MRVLAIRGQNLTSLAGDFEVDFESEPLASAGIFAITGPTGAGKSTLLDAVCLALFNHVPRLASAARGQVGAAGGETISADDPRALLRHRAGEGFAEVDFIGLDRGRYRAGWYVKRARLRSDGALQLVQQTFTNLDTGEVYGGTRTETLNAIRNKVGLTAQQFGRAVMLAQGDFNAFIDADSNTRAELLEKLTGTDLYARLGVAARAKADRLREALKAIELRIAAQNGLDDIQRAEAEDRLSKASGEHEAAKDLLAARERDRNWHARARELAMHVEAAEQARGAAELKWSEAEPRRVDIANRRVAFAIVPAWQAAADATAKVIATEQRISELDGEAIAAREREVETLAVDGAAAEKLRLAEQVRERERPNLEAARALDTRIAELGAKLTPLTAAREAASGDVEASGTRRATAISERDEATAVRKVLVDWLDANRLRSSLAARRDDLAADLDEHADLSKRVDALQAEAGTLATRLSEARVSLVKAETSATMAREALTAAEEAGRIARAALPTPDAAAAAETERDRLTGVEPCLLAFERAAFELGRQTDAIEADRAELGRIDAQLAASNERKGEIDAASPVLEARHAEAMRAGALSAAASGDAAERLRAELVAGEPCPVCGGTDHALEALAGLIHGRAAEDAHHVAELAAEITALGKERAVLLDRIGQDGARCAAVAVRIEKGETAVSTAADVRDAASTKLQEALDPCAIDVAIGPQAIRAEVSSRLGVVEDRRALFLRAREDEKRFSAALDAARTTSSNAVEQERVARQTVRDLEAEAGRNAERLGDAGRRRDQVAAGLDDALNPLFDWRIDTTAVGTLDGLVEVWQDKTREIAAIDAELPGLGKAASDAEIEHGREAARLEGAVKAERACGDERDKLIGERAPMLGGETVETVADRIAKAVEAASTKREAARIACDGARSAAAAAQARHGQAVKSLELEQADAEMRTRTFDAELVARQVSLELVERVAANGESALDAEAKALAEIDRTVVAAEAELRTRVEDRDAHAATEAPMIQREALDEALREAGTAEAAARAELSEAEFVVRQDDRARDATAALRLALDRECAAAHPWFQLDVLIGDATGNKFRKYAQGLTLERLLLHANVRLEELKPRYSLERAPGGEMLVQVVDNDMAGEIRGLPNLSGGERFLVSLALALGLSEMSTGQGLRVESLFIDEGFGALDSASLGQAIGVLEQLHATGRRVGVISHIEDVKERIAVKIAVTPASNGSSAIEVQSE